MKIATFRALATATSLFFFVVSAFRLHAGAPPPAEFRSQFFKLCDLAAEKVTNEDNKVPFFSDSYGVRALCVAYDMTGNEKYLDACRNWSERMVKHQEQMTPPGAYYMHYNRKPGETNGDWYSADSSSIGMAVLATSIRCKGQEQQRFQRSVENFADLVIKNYVKPSGGVSDGLWHQSSDEWWCSSGIFGSMSFLLYARTGNEQYLKAGLGAANWLAHWDLAKEQPFPLHQQGPSMIMYVMECFSAGWPYISKDKSLKSAAQEKVSWCLDWIAQQQAKPALDRQWPVNKGWGLKFGGLPFHQYVFSQYLPADGKLTAAGDAEIQQHLASLVFPTDHPALKQLMPTIQLPMFLSMSYAERLDPGAIYRSK